MITCNQEEGDLVPTRGLTMQPKLIIVPHANHCNKVFPMFPPKEGSLNQFKLWLQQTLANKTPSAAENTFCFQVVFLISSAASEELFITEELWNDPYGFQISQIVQVAISIRPTAENGSTAMQ